ncbi:YtxH domain-containing protein [Candidatus Chlamydia sanziniae]|uniref:YtxH-like protein n=1 Tax=Candidatus Chlamydia sanziniae TaxID=1806891 RepID=A0A1A9HW57_9CHLA|nr:YtxH domain-containing protein [Candidatus Chlamydia sanziniae]ANH78333.1 hypothetical protein Cs308_0162 [Candidatus Chlamydia sanziniae]
MFRCNRKCKKIKNKRCRWLRGVLFGGLIATLLTCLFTPKSGIQLRKKISKVKNTGAKKGKTLLKNSKQHTKAFLQHTKLLAKNISKEVKNFSKAIIDENKD